MQKWTISALLGGKFIPFTFIIIIDVFDLFLLFYIVLLIYPAFFLGLFPLFCLQFFFSFPTHLKSNYNFILILLTTIPKILTCTLELKLTFLSSAFSKNI